MEVLHVFKIDDGERHHVIAKNMLDALWQLAETHGYETTENYLEDCEPSEVEQLRLSDAVSFLDESDVSDSPTVTATCAEWIKERGRGILCSTCY